jgi:hypothetical protein
MVWIIEDSRGNALRQGTLSPGESLPQIGAMRNEFASAARRASASESAKASEATSPSAGAAAPAAPAAAVGQLTAPPDWTIQVTRNAAGIPVQVAIAREDPP